MEKPANLILVIFGATGDLTSRKLVPALYSLRNQDLMPEKFTLLGVGRSAKTTEDFRVEMANAITTSSEEKESDFSHVTDFTECFEYQRTDSFNPVDYESKLIIGRLA
jgi:glucose-6-phosphate 1-dehydrogenase